MATATRIISIIGPESTGKSTLAKQLGEFFNAPVVPEFARTFLEMRDGSYKESDLIEIAKGQMQSEQSALSQNPPILICDTDLVVIKIWQEFKYGRANPQIDEWFRNQSPRTHLLTYPDLPWEDDPLRENPMDLIQLFHVYEDVLKSHKADYFVVRGMGEERLNATIDLLRQ